MTPPLHCSFCNKDDSDVRKLIAGPAGFAICDECVAVCNDLLADGAVASAGGAAYSQADDPEMRSLKCPACGHRWGIPR